ncbi:MAG: mechanosensitive ion channel family protein [Anaerolineales bacterium]|nr:mechanosensitive ion channel family protein [Anaerolineales bacterium]
MMTWMQEVGIAILIILASWLLSRLSNWALTWVIQKLVGRTKTHLDDAVVEAGKSPLQLAILLGGVEMGLGQISFLPITWLPQLDRLFFAGYALTIFLFLYRLAGGVMSWYGREIVHKTETELDDQFLDLFRYIVQIALTATVVIIVLGRFGIEVSALVTTLGIGSLAVALAAQETLGNMLSGFTIMVDRPFKVGDRIEILDIDTWGDVVEIGLRSTRILTRDHRMVSVPNSVIGKRLVVNYSDPSTTFRVQTTVGVAYGTNVEQARQVMIDAIQAQDWVMKEKRIEALFLEFGESSLNFTVRCWIEDYVETRRIVDKMNTVLYQALHEAGIEIPFPRRDLHLISASPSLLTGVVSKDG